MTASPDGSAVSVSSPSGVDPLPAGPDGLRCSARDCRQAAVTDLRWNNPKIHVDSRRKHWLACADHETSLGDHLSARGFLREALAL
ncbi:MAG TPA: acetone carboxylase [Propionibacteriaceae bacterium]